MTNRKWTLVLVLGMLVAAGAFASGDKEDDADRYGAGRPGGRADRGGFAGGPGMMGGAWDRSDFGADRQEAFEERQAALLEDSESFEGTFLMAEDRYPALVDGDGETWYLMIRIPMDQEDIPEDGAALKVRALRMPMSPVHLMVLEAEVDGEVLEAEWPPEDRWGCGPAGGRRGMTGRSDRFGGRPGPGWGYPDDNE